MGFDSTFKEKKEALGHFWPEDEIENVWEGRIIYELFPTLELLTLSDKDIDPKTKTVHGVSKDAEYFSLFNTHVSPGSWYHSASLRADEIKAPVGGKIYTVYADFMLVGSSLYSDRASVKRISFYSNNASDAFCIWPDVTFADLKFRQTSRGFRQPRLRKTIRSIVLDGPLPLRVRCIKPTVPSTKDEGCQFILSFMAGKTPHEALVHILSLRDLLTFLSGTYIDISEVSLHHLHTHRTSNSRIYFGDPRRVQPDKKPFFLSILPIMADSNIFATVFTRWARENESYRRARRAFNDILLDDDKVTFSHIRELVTIIEMTVDDDARFISRDLFSRLRIKLNEAAEQFLNVLNPPDPKTADGVKSIMSKVDYLNRDSATQKMRTAICRLPTKIRQECFEDVEAFAKATIKLRDHLTHDMSRLTPEDYMDANWYVTKLKAIYSINEAIRLSPDGRINEFCAIIRDAVLIGLKAPSDRTPSSSK